jgi:hypothetical protein
MAIYERRNNRDWVVGVRGRGMVDCYIRSCELFDCFFFVLGKRNYIVSTINSITCTRLLRYVYYDDSIIN